MFPVGAHGLTIWLGSALEEFPSGWQRGVLRLRPGRGRRLRLRLGVLGAVRAAPIAAAAGERGRGSGERRVGGNSSPKRATNLQPKAFTAIGLDQ